MNSAVDALLAGTPEGLTSDLPMNVTPSSTVRRLALMSPVSRALDLSSIRSFARNAPYNLDPQTRFHPKGRDNGYILTIGGRRIYVAGDTENIPEKKALSDIDAAFLPMNRPFTMTPEMAAEAARSFKPRLLYPYHYGNTDPQELVELLKDTPEIEVRIRDLR